MSIDFPKTEVAALEQLAARLFERRKFGTELGSLARDLLSGMHDVCMRAGLDRVLDELVVANPGIDIADRTALADHDDLHAALVTRLSAIDLDGGGPLNLKPRQLAQCTVDALGLTLVDEPDRAIALGDDARAAVTAALSAVANVELAAPKIRDTIIAEARARTEEKFHAAFTKLAAQLDDRGVHLIKLPKVPIDALHAVQHALFETRTAIIERVASAAIDRAKAALEPFDGEAAARIDQPITARSTPRQVAILRACDPEVGTTPARVVYSLLESLVLLARITWRAAEKPVRPYGARTTFAVGEVIEHPKFGRGEVTAVAIQRIEVEFPDGMHTLAHALK